MKRLYPILLFLCFNCFGQEKIIDQKRDSIIKYGLSSYFDRDTLLLKKATKELYNLYSYRNDSLSLAKFHHFKALKHRIQFRLDSSYYYYHESKNISILLKDSLEVGKRLLSMCYMQKDEKDYVGAEITIIEGLKYLEPLEEKLFIGHSLNALGNVLVELNRFEESRDYYNKALELYQKLEEKNNREKNWLEIQNNIGNSYLIQNDPEKALIYLQKGLSFPEIQGKYPEVYQKLLGNESDCKYINGNRESAMQGFKKLLTLREKDKNTFGESLSHNGLAYYYLIEKENQKALFHAKKGYELAKEASNNATRMSALLKLGALTFGNESKRYYQEYAQLSDSLNNRERYYKNQFAKVRYETEKKDIENANLKLEKEQERQEKENQEQQKIIFLLTGALALLGSVTYFRNRRKKLVYKAQLEKVAAREEERQQIAKSLHDEVAGDLRMIHQKLIQNNNEEAKNVESVKENVRNLSHQLSSVSFEEVSFKDQIINLISDSFSPSFRIRTEAIDSVIWKEINSTIKRTIYLCIRESLQNTIKYGEASQFIISFSMEKKTVKVTLTDNGKGFDIDKKRNGIGLKNQKERVEEINGSFSIESSEEGTKTSINIPLNGR